MANSEQKINVSVMGTQTDEMGLDKKIAPAVKVFGCQLRLPSMWSKIFDDENFDYGICRVSFHVFKNNFGKVRTVCYGEFDIFEKYSYLTLADKGSSHIDFAGVARLHSKYPEEFDVKVGIRKSFSRAMDSLISNMGFIYENRREYRELVWDRFENILTKNFYATMSNPYGIWTPNWMKDRKTIRMVSNYQIKYLVNDLIEE